MKIENARLYKIASPVLLISLALAGLFFLQQHNYLLFHGLIEIFSIIVAMAVFVFSWNTNRFIENDFFLFVGIGFLFMGILDTLHTLSYKGMGVFAAEANLATQLWILARYLQSFTFLFALIFINKKIKKYLLMIIYSTVTSLGLLSIFYWENFPKSFIEGYGLTNFKIYSEYAIVFIFFTCLILLNERGGMFSRGVRRLLFASIAVAIAAELSFTLYTDVYGITNMVGHYFKVISFFLIYKAIVETGLLKPYGTMFRSLKKREEDYRFIVENQSELIDRLDAEGNYLFVSPSYCKFYEKKRQELIGKNFLMVVDPEDREKAKNAMKKLRYPPHESTSVQRVEKDGKTRWVEWTNKAVLDRDGKVISIIGTGRDVTERREAEQEVKYLAFHDRLTGLYSRQYFDQELKRLDTKRKLPLSIIIGDVNGLKLINDTFGYKKGDQLLRKIAKIFKDGFRKDDVITRWGGDEFAVILPNTPQEKGLEIIKRINENCRQKSNRNLGLSISLGISTKESENENIKEVVKKAEAMMYQHELTDERSIRSSIISSLINALKERDYETKEHVGRIKDMCLALGKKLGLSESRLVDLSLLSTMHDIGKISVPDHIFFKPSKLTDSEWEMMKRHVEVGYRIAESSIELAPIAEAILSHHERWDGGGYPRGLKGEQIPVTARILAVVDAYDAMTHDRPYRKAMGKKEAIAELRRCAGAQFDPLVVEVFINFLQE